MMEEQSRREGAVAVGRSGQCRRLVMSRMALTGAFRVAFAALVVVIGACTQPEGGDTTGSGRRTGAGGATAGAGGAGEAGGAGGGQQRL